jgi:predicted regulator of Ras-like GTPase activity (Roadblock/LC7/MglB family)
MTSTTTDISWLMANFQQQTPGVIHTLLLSADGLKRAWSPELSTDDADNLAAIGSGLANLAESANSKFDVGGSPRSVNIDFPAAQLLLMRAGAGAQLCALAEADADIGVVGYSMVRLIDQLAEHLGVAPRTEETQTS